MNLRKLILLVVITALISSFFIFDLGQYLDLTNLKTQQEAFSEQVSANPWVIGGAYFFLYVLVTALSLPTKGSCAASMRFCRTTNSASPPCSSWPRSCAEQIPRAWI
ncbi:hypothetical protein NRG23_09005 [Pseudomonas sp. T8]|nr:hypothetical protein NRG23_09005 [Pseudomonas sp. T8]